MKEKVLVILGPTATGKSDLAVRLAKKFNGEVISADSRQVYKGLNIGTGKITKKEMMGIKHHLLDVADPKKQFSAVKYTDLAQQKIEEIIKKGKLPIICGGTGFYIQSLIDGISLPDVPPNNALRKKLKGKTPAELMEILKKLDNKRSKNIDPFNSRRIIRSIEIASALGKVPLIKKQSSQFSALFIGLTMNDRDLKRKINLRLEKRIRKGMIGEAQRLHRNGLSWKRMHELGLEYRFMALYIQKKNTKQEMKKLLEFGIWHYAKRQMTWFKKDKRIKWFEPNEYNKIKKEVNDFLL